nr:DUF3761 domain-containing protein [Candidimonas nitroreducens]
MKTLMHACTFAAGALALTLGMASAPALAAGSSAAPAPGATALCKDGTTYSGTSKRSACSGHKGVKEWYGAPSAPKAQPHAAAPAAPAAHAAPAAGATALCKDGTSYSGASKRGACSGHKGVKEWYGAQGAAQPPAGTTAPQARSAAPSTGAAAPAMRRAEPAHAAAAGGGAGKVWVNTDSKVYHCQGDRWYGTTKSGQYMSESQARSMGARPDHGKACS